MPGADSRRMRRESGFTLVEVVAVMVVMGILLAVAVGFSTSARVRASDAAAKSNIEVALPAMQGYYLDNGTFTGMTLRRLQRDYSPGIANITVVSAGAATFCVRSRVDGRSWFLAGPSADITSTRCR